MMTFFLNVLSGSFPSESEARAFADLDYSVDPDEPLLPLDSAIGDPGIDIDFVETIWGDSRHAYLKTLLRDPADLDVIRSRERPADNTFFLIMEIDDNRDITIDSACDPLKYCGRFRAHFSDP